jgi:hypothetical protein
MNERFVVVTFLLDGSPRINFCLTRHEAQRLYSAKDNPRASMWCEVIEVNEAMKARAQR